MARIKGIIRVRGKVGDVSFYKLNGKEVARMAGGPSGQQIRKRKSMQRQRQNINEFYHAASPAGKVLRMTLTEMKHLWDPYVSGRLTALLRKMMQLEEGKPGERSLSVLRHAELLKEFRFHPAYSLERFFKATCEVKISESRNEVVLHVPLFDAAVMIDAPSGATHGRLLFGIVVLSEYVFVKNGTRFKAVDPANGEKCVVYSDYIDVKSKAVSVDLIASLSPDLVPAASSAVIVAIGIEFYQEVGSRMYGIKGGGMRVDVNSQF